MSSRYPTAPGTFNPINPDAEFQAYGPTNNALRGPFPFMGKFYMFGLIGYDYADNVIDGYRMYQSSDGLTWQPYGLMQLSANQATPNVVPVMNGNLVTVAQGDGVHLFFQDFDLVRGTWSATYGSQAIANSGVLEIFLRMDRTLLVIYNNTVAGNQEIFAALYSLQSGQWLFSGTNLGTNIGAPPPLIQSYSALDGLNNLHMMLTVPATGTYYQQFTAQNQLGSFHDFTGDAKLIGTQSTFPVIFGGAVLWPVLYTGTFGAAMVTLYIGTPISAPVWSVLAVPGIDPDTFNAYIASGATTAAAALPPTLVVNGGTILGVYGTNTVAGVNQLRLTQSTVSTFMTSAGWTGSQLIYDYTAAADANSVFFQQALAQQLNVSLQEFTVLQLPNNSVIVSSEMSILGGNPALLDIRYSLGPIAPLAPVLGPSMQGTRWITLPWPSGRPPHKFPRGWCNCPNMLVGKGFKFDQSDLKRRRS
jgi:hypothetical protein